MKKTTKLLSMVLAVLLIASVMPLPAFAAPERFDAVAGATGGGGGDDDDDTPSSFGNSPVDPALYDLSPFDPDSFTGTALADLMNGSPIFFAQGDSCTQLMYYCIKGYAYMFYLYGGSYSDYVGISYGYNDMIEVRDTNVWSSLAIGTPKADTEAVYRGEASVSDGEGSFLALDVYASANVIADLAADDAASIGSWGSLISARKAEYVGRSVNDPSGFDAVTSATKYSAALKEAVFDALGFETDEPAQTASPTAAPTAAPTADPEAPEHHKYVTEGDGEGEYVIHLNVTAEDGVGTVVTPGEPTVTGANIVLVVDVSASIEGDSLAALNDSIRSLVSELPSGSQVGLVTFADGASEGEVYSCSDEVPTVTTTEGESNLAPALVNAKALLNEASAWKEPENGKVIVVISDGELTDPDASIEEANGGSANDIHYYTISVNTGSVYVPGEVYWVMNAYGSGADYSMAMMQAVSSNYPNARAEDTSFIYRTVVLGERNPDGRDYAFGTDGADWSSVFETITQNETVEQKPVAMSGAVIEDVLSEYTELASPELPEGGVTVDGSEDYTVAAEGKTVRVILGGELTDGKVYTVNIPVRLTDAAQAAANASPERSVDLPTNDGAALTCSWGERTMTAEYSEHPTVTVHKQQFTLKVHFVYAEGGAAAEDVVTSVYCGENFEIVCPVIEGYAPDPDRVTGTMGLEDIELTVVYSCSVLPGDANCDGVVDMADISALSAYLLKECELSAQGLLNAEASGNGVVDSSDLSAIFALI